MASKYKQPNLSSAVRFTKAPMSEVEFSRMEAPPKVITTFNAGDIVPFYYQEVLPHSTYDVDFSFVNRLLSSTVKPTMGTMELDVYAFFVPNRIINESWKNVQGENTSSFWSTPEIQLAPLYPSNLTAAVQVPPMSVADYYGFPTQAPIPAVVLQQCNDLKIRGYLSIYNNNFRDQNYEAPIPYSKLNVYNGFFEPAGTRILPDRSAGSLSASIQYASNSDGSYPSGAISKALYGEGTRAPDDFDGRYKQISLPYRNTTFSALDRPLKANKLHDVFTSVLPSPQKGPEVFFGIADTAPVTIDTVDSPVSFPSGNYLGLRSNLEGDALTVPKKLLIKGDEGGSEYTNLILYGDGDVEASFPGKSSSRISGSNLVGIADLSQATGVSVSDLRMSAAVQQVYEILARGGSRYIESLRSLFGIQAESPFKDVPTQLGHIRRELDLYQVAQTSSSSDESTYQGNLAGFGYTAKGGDLIHFTSLEHGYIHYLCVVRQRNMYSTLMMPDNFRMSTLDFYLPPLANISEQPVRKAILNPFAKDSMESTIGFQEAWWEYRYEPDRVTGYARSGLDGSLGVWTYADSYDADFSVVNGDWLKSNAQEVLDRTLNVPSSIAPQFIIMFEFKVNKQLPMPTYSVPGMDII